MRFFLVMLMLLFTATSNAFDGKQQPIKFVIPFAPGGGSDLVVRAYERHLSDMGYSVVLDYKPGAEGFLGKKDYLEKNDKSGYSLLINGSSFLAVEDYFAKDKGWDINNFTLVSNIAYIPSVLVSSKKSNITSFSQLKVDIEQGRKINIGAGAAQVKYNSLALLSSFRHSPDQIVVASYKGAGPALNDVIGGHTDLSLLPINMVLTHHSNDKLNILFVGSSERNKKIPNVPSITEIIPGASYVGYWGVVLPRGVDESIVKFYTDLFRTIASKPAFQLDMNSLDMHISPVDIGPIPMKRNYDLSIKQFQNIK